MLAPKKEGKRTEEKTGRHFENRQRAHYFRLKTVKFR